SLPERFNYTRKRRPGHHDQAVLRAATADLHRCHTERQPGVPRFLLCLTDVRGQLVTCRVFTLHDKRDYPQIPYVVYPLLCLTTRVQWGRGISELIPIRGQEPQLPGEKFRKLGLPPSPTAFVWVSHERPPVATAAHQHRARTRS